MFTEDWNKEKEMERMEQNVNGREKYRKGNGKDIEKNINRREEYRKGNGKEREEQ